MIVQHFSAKCDKVGFPLGKLIHPCTIVKAFDLLSRFTSNTQPKNTTMRDTTMKDSVGRSVQFALAAFVLGLKCNSSPRCQVRTDNA
jgi:hypothetical protein